MKLRDFNKLYPVEQVAVFSALIQQVKECTGNEFGYLSDVTIPGGVTKKEFDKIVAEFIEADIVYKTGVKDGYSINDNMEDAFDSDNTKQHEISLIRALINADGYFAEFFKSDFEQMIINIEDDHPIELYTGFISGFETQRQRGDELIEKHATEKHSLCETMLCVASETGNERLYQRVIEEIGIDSTIKLKRFIGLDLDGKEIDYLVSKI